MVNINGVQAIVYDVEGDYFCLIFRRIADWRGWELPKTTLNENETPEQGIKRLMDQNVGIKHYTILKKIEQKKEFKDGDNVHSYDIFIIKANMNTPVSNYNKTKKHDNYLWISQGSIKNKLTWDDDKSFFDIAIELIKTLFEKPVDYATA